MYDDDEDFKEDVKETATLFAWVFIPALLFAVFVWFTSS